MTVGLAALLNSWLNTIRGGGAGTTYTTPAALYIKLHTADPSAAGTSNASAVTTRQAVTYGAPSSGTISLSNAPAFSMTATETISHVSVWDNVSAGNCLFTAALTTGKSVVNTDTLTFGTFTFALAPVAV